jgi:DNA-binding XRE family transcriptional regulator
MECVNKLLDKCKETCDPRTDMALAKKLGIERTTVSSYRNERSLPDTVVCAKIAEITGIPLAKVLGTIGEARAKSEAEKKVWRRLANMASASTGCVMVLSVLTVLSYQLHGSSLRIVCILCYLWVCGILLILLRNHGNQQRRSLRAIVQRGSAKSDRVFR